MRPSRQESSFSAARDPIRGGRGGVAREVACAGLADAHPGTAEFFDTLRRDGLAMLYVGLESGDAATLAAMHKAEDPATIVDGCRRAKAAGFKVSVTVPKQVRENWYVIASDDSHRAIARIAKAKGD